MKRAWIVIVSALSLLGLVAVPYQLTLQPWRYDPINYAKTAKWAGCHARVVVDMELSPLESYYTYSAEKGLLLIGGAEDKNVPYYAGLVVALHETGHCLQHQEGTLKGPIVAIELNADMRAADLACSLGLDGKQLLIDTFTWAHDEFGYDGDPWHGTLQERMSQGDLAPACNKRIEQ